MAAMHRHKEVQEGHVELNQHRSAVTASGVLESLHDGLVMVVVVDPASLKLNTLEGDFRFYGTEFLMYQP